LIGSGCDTLHAFLAEERKLTGITFDVIGGADRGPDAGVWKHRNRRRALAVDRPPHNSPISDAEDAPSVADASGCPESSAATDSGAVLAIPPLMDRRAELTQNKPVSSQRSSQGALTHRSD